MAVATLDPSTSCHWITTSDLYCIDSCCRLIGTPFGSTAVTRTCVSSASLRVSSIPFCRRTTVILFPMSTFLISPRMRSPGFKPGSGAGRGWYARESASEAAWDFGFLSDDTSAMVPKSMTSATVKYCFITPSNALYLRRDSLSFLRQLLSCNGLTHCFSCRNVHSAWTLPLLSDSQRLLQGRYGRFQLRSRELGCTSSLGKLNGSQRLLHIVFHQAA